MSDSDKVTTTRLKRGDRIFAKTTNRKGHLERATSRIDRRSIVVTVERLEMATGPSVRRGYRVFTDRGVIDFASGAQVHFLASQADERTAVELAEPAEAPGVLGGLTMTPEESQAAVHADERPVPRGPAQVGRANGSAPSSAPSSPAEVLARMAPPRPANARQVRTIAGLAKMPRGRGAADNYRAQARASKTEAAKRFWLGLVAYAEEKVEVPDVVDA